MHEHSYNTNILYYNIVLFDCTCNIVRSLFLIDTVLRYSKKIENKSM